MKTSKHELIISHIYLADKIAKCKKRNLHHISLEELQSAAYFGLVQAANKYNYENNDCFAAFAVWRIAGAIKDYLRELSWGSRNRNMKKSDYLSLYA